MRSKASHINEGGVSKGSGCIDSPFIVSSNFFVNATDSVKGILKASNQAN